MGGCECELLLVLQVELHLPVATLLLLTSCFDTLARFPASHSLERVGLWVCLVGVADVQPTVPACRSFPTALGGWGVRLEVAILPTYPALSAVIVVAVRLAFPAFCLCYWFRSSVPGPPQSPGQQYFSLAELSLGLGDLISLFPVA